MVHTNFEKTIETIANLNRKDMKVFQIEDNRQCVNAVSVTFFPMLQQLLKHTKNRIQDIYGISPDVKMTEKHHPAYRPTTKQPDFENRWVLMGLTGKRRVKKNDKPLILKKVMAMTRKYIRQYFSIPFTQKEKEVFGLILLGILSMILNMLRNY